MKKLLYTFLLIIAVVISGVELKAMPPHTDLLMKWRDEGTLEKNVMKAQAPACRTRAYPDKSSSIALKSTIYIPVVLVAYNGQALNSGSDAGFYEDLLNGVNADAMSVTKYYKDMSNEKLTIVFEVLYTATASGDSAYYGAPDGSSHDVLPGELVYEAVRETVDNLDATVDFSKYDNDSDGYVDCVVIVHAGSGEEKSGSENEIWSHQWDLYSAEYYGYTLDGHDSYATSDGVTFNTYTIQPEYVEAPGDSTVGVFCHELGHVFGLPDLYDTTGATKGAGIWSLMSSGSWGPPGGDGSRPAPLLAWERYMIGGYSWITIADINPVSTIDYKDRGLPGYSVLLLLLLFLPFLLAVKEKYRRIIYAPVPAVLLAVAVACTIEPAVSVMDGAVYDIEAAHAASRIPLPNNQYLLLEGKTAATLSGWYVPGTGVLVTHIHSGIISTYLYDNKVNAGNTRVHGVNVVEAGTNTEPGKLWMTGTYYGSASDLFCAENKSTLSTSTTPGTEYYTSESVSSKTGNPGVSITSFSTNTSWPITFHAEY